MKTGTKIVLAAVGAVVTYQLIITLSQIIERHMYYKQARDYCDQVGKPLLCVGMKQLPWHAPDGDVTVDVDPGVLRRPGGVIADERDMPFADKQFGFCYNGHTLEHMGSAENVELAVNECLRVSDKAVFLTPSPADIMSAVLHPGHHIQLWYDKANNKIKVAPNKWRTGFGFSRDDSVKIGQAIVFNNDDLVEIEKTGNAYII